MSVLKETVLLKKTYFRFLFPSFVLGLVSLFNPFLFALVPAHESGICLCNIQSSRNEITLLNIPVLVLLGINTFMFYCVNFFFLLFVVLMLYKIRHIKDKLETRYEMGYLVAFWTFFCCIQYSLFLFDQINMCPSMKPVFRHSYITSYYCMLLRDLVMLVITCYYLRKVSTDKQTS